MLTALRLAFSDLLRPEQRGPLLISLVSAIGLLLALCLGAALLLSRLHLAGIPWLDTTIEIAGSLAALVLAWALFPAMTMLILGFFLDRVVAAVERRHYPELPPARHIGIGEAVVSALRILALALVVNLVLLPVYFLPPINLFIYYGLNGYVVGREYFELVALRRLDGAAARAMWRWHRGRLILAGVVIVFLLSLPLFNLVAPVVAAAFMLHVFEGLRRASVETFATRGGTGLIGD
ncbi:MAG TPA: EI24 domain-containing protein [Stellaceae bacterium]|nr:EI24 domain-containing protein [Stellaceae bacterium]